MQKINDCEAESIENRNYKNKNPVKLNCFSRATNSDPPKKIEQMTFKELVNPFQTVISCKHKKTDLLYHVMIVVSLDKLKLALKAVIPLKLLYIKFRHCANVFRSIFNSDCCILNYDWCFWDCHSITSESLYYVLQHQEIDFEKTTL